MASDRNDCLVFFCNGKKIIEDRPDPEATLLGYLRNNLQLTGSKEGCGVGACGACTVMISSKQPDTKEIHHVAVNACLYPVCAVHGKAVTTVEGIGSTRTKLHAVQERLAKAHGSQCGFCTPGMVMSMYTLLRNHPKPTNQQLLRAVEGNLCRCTGYRPILDAFKTFTKEPCGENCQCFNGQSNGEITQDQDQTNGDINTEPIMTNGSTKMTNGHTKVTNGPSNGSTNVTNGSAKVTNGQINMSNGSTKMTNGHDAPTKIIDGYDSKTYHSKSSGLYTPALFTDYDPSQDIIFPPELLTPEGKHLLSSTSWFRYGDNAWASIGSLEELLELKSKHPKAPIIAGNTALGIQKKFTGMAFPVTLAPIHVSELQEISLTDDGLVVGSMVTVTQLYDACQKHVSEIPEEKRRTIDALLEILGRFAGEQIRNVATIGGHLKAAQPHSDLNTFFIASRCSVTLAAHKGSQKTIPVSGDFFPARWRTNVAEDEVIVNINIPFNRENEYINVYKVSRRNHVDTAIVNSAFRLELDQSTETVQDICLVYGGIAATTKVAKDTASALIGKKWNKDMLAEAYEGLVNELTLDPSSPGGMVEYRHALILSCFFKFYIDVMKQAFPDNQIENPATLKSVLRNFDEEFPDGSQVFQPVPSDQPSIDPVGRPIVHAAALQQTTGEAEYIDDVPQEQGETYLGLVMSKRACANIISIDPSKALAHPGVIDYVGVDDIPGENRIKGEAVFASGKVEYHGQIIGGIIAKSPAIARKAAKMVDVQYDNLTPIVSIKDAIAKKSFQATERFLDKGNVEAAFKQADHVTEGVVHIGGQEHFYIETHGCIAKPKEDGEMDIHTPVQWPQHVQMSVCKLLGEKANRIRCHVRRIGGAFGGKCYRIAPALVCAVAARKCGKPVRLILSRTEDMALTGTRQPTYAEYKAGFSDTGILQALKVKIYADAGITEDCIEWVMTHVLFNLDSVYAIDNVHVTATCCRTNKQTNTAFRGYGAPEAIHIIENVMYDIGIVCQLSQIQVRDINFHRAKPAVTYYGSSLDEFHNFHRCWLECVQKSNYQQKRRVVDVYNAQNRWTKRGLAIIPNKHLVGMLPNYKLQCMAMVTIYTDGTILIHQSGIEMGQGIYTKMIQVASRVLGVPHELIHCQETSTNTVPNQYGASASCTADRNGYAIKNACEILMERLKPIKEANPQGSWEDWILSAYHSRVNLAAIGFYKNDVGWDWSTKSGRPFMYPVYGAACSEVEVDCLTGSHRVLRTDIVIDIGRSLNPAIDIGQIEGAFMQGYGLFALEDHRYSPDGILLTNGPHAYKIPCFTDVPAEFNITLLRNTKAERAVYSSKGVAEPPVPLANSVFFAIKDAIQSARADVGLPGPFRLDSPATGERVRLACSDHLVGKFPVAEPGTYKPWESPL